MTIPGETERAAIKVVPIYFDPVVEPIEAYTEPAPTPAPEPAPQAKPHRSGILGGLALVVAMATVVLTAVAVSVASTGDYDAGNALGWAAIVTSGVAILAGLVAAVFRLGRGTGIAAILLGAFANPWLLTSLLGFFVPA